LTEVSKAQEKLFKAKLEATDKPNERIALLEEQLKIAKNVLDFTEKSYKAGFQITEVEFLRAKAHYLTIEIKLLKEREKNQPKSS
jgi:outer membrane protein TolC